MKHLTFYEAERNSLPIDHTIIGAHMAAKWQLPQGLIDAIRWHHDFQPANKSANFVQNIYLANFIVNAYDLDPTAPESFSNASACCQIHDEYDG